MLEEYYTKISFASIISVLEDSRWTERLLVREAIAALMYKYNPSSYEDRIHWSIKEMFSCYQFF